MELSYTIAMNNIFQEPITGLNSALAVIKDLKPDRVYIVTFTAFVTYDGIPRRIGSDEKQLQMLPAGIVM